MTFDGRHDDGGFRFKVGPIPVRVEPSFLIFLAVIAVLGLRPSMGARMAVIQAGSVAIAIFISILAHELGHAFCAKFLGLFAGEVVIKAFGGYALIRPDRSRLEMFLIAAAGPFVDFLIAGGVFLLYFVIGLSAWSDIILKNDFIFQLGSFLFVINLFWGFINLLPIYPMDGAFVLQSFIGGSLLPTGVGHTVHVISVFTSILCIGVCLMFGFTFLTIWCVLFLIQNIQWSRFR